jgi:uncharacterized membrane protein HdeD (DUF308 family)
VADEDAQCDMHRVLNVVGHPAQLFAPTLVYWQMRVGSLGKHAVRGTERAVSNVTADQVGDEISHHRGWFIFLGLVLILVGAAAIAFPLLGTLAVAVSTAIAFAIAGVAQTLHAFAARSWSGFLFDLLIGLLYLATGVVLWLNPLGGAVTLTAILAVVLMLDGVFRSALAFRVRPGNGWVWLLFGGIVSIIFGIMIWQQLPSSALWILGLLLGINLIFSGLTFFKLGSARLSDR